MEQIEDFLAAKINGRTMVGTKTCVLLVVPPERIRPTFMSDYHDDAFLVATWLRSVFCDRTLAELKKEL
jgi:hypothetical protein